MRLLMAIGIGVILLAGLFTTYNSLRPQNTQEIRTNAVASTNLSFSPSTVSAAPGSQFSVSVIMNSGTNSVSAVELHLAVDPTKLQPVSITTAGYMPVVITQGSVTSSQASIILGSNPQTPKKGTGTIATVTFQVVGASGSTSISVASTTRIAAVGEKTNVFAGSSPVTVKIAGSVTPTTTPTQPYNWCAGPEGATCGVPLCPPAGPGTVTCDGISIGTCHNNTCIPKVLNTTPTPTPTALCSSDSDCPGGYYCSPAAPIKCPLGATTNGVSQVIICAGPAVGPRRCWPNPTPTTAQSCSHNGSQCNISDCPICVGQMCSMRPCRLIPGTCTSNKCVPNPTTTPPPDGWCPGPNGSSCPVTSQCNNTATCTGTTCVYQLCPVNLTGGTCVNNRCIPAGPSVPPPPPTRTPTPTPIHPYNWCAGPDGTSCGVKCPPDGGPGTATCNSIGVGTCQNNICVLKTLTSTPTPRPTSVCTQNGSSCIVPGCGNVCPPGAMCPAYCLLVKGICKGGTCVSNPADTPIPLVIPGDMNHNGAVDMYDYNQLVGDYGKKGTPGFIPSDLDVNGIVNIYDYNIILGNFGKSL